METWELASSAVVPEVIVDIRPPEQFERAHLHGAINITYNDFQLHVLKLVDLEAHILVVDSGGARAAEMAVWLRAREANAQYLVGGMSAWRGPLEKS